jgi:hypothetical protein
MARKIITVETIEDDATLKLTYEIGSCGDLVLTHGEWLYPNGRESLRDEKLHARVDTLKDLIENDVRLEQA